MHSEFMDFQFVFYYNIFRCYNQFVEQVYFIPAGFTGKGRDELERLMGEMGVIDKYGVT